MSMSWSNLLFTGLTPNSFQKYSTSTDLGAGNLEQQADLFFHQITEAQAQAAEDAIYNQLLCAQIANAEAQSEARATVFDAMHASLSRMVAQPHNPVVLVEPEPDILKMFTPTDLCNYSQQTRLPLLQRSPHDHLRQRKCYGVHPFALEVAREYMLRHGDSARRIILRAVLERDLEDKYAAALLEPNFPRTNKILFAIAHGLKLVHVRRGRTLEWNQFRDNHGNHIQ